MRGLSSPSRRLPPCVLIVGTARSGTTWLGELLDHSPSVTYKYEPFSLVKETPYNEWLATLESADPEISRAAFIRIVDRAVFDIDRPAPIRKEFGRRGRLATAVNALGYRQPVAQRLFAYCGPLDGRRAGCVVIKDVALLPEQIEQVRRTLGAQVLHIVRNPYSVVASSLRGRNLGVFLDDEGLERRRVRLRRLRRSIPEDSWPPGLGAVESLQPIELEALRWRLDTELTSAVLGVEPGVRTVVFEHAVVDPAAAATELCSFLGWPPGVLDPALADAEDGSDGYFGTNKDPGAVITSWKNELSEEQIDAVRRIVAGSPSMQWWPELGDPCAEDAS